MLATLLGHCTAGILFLGKSVNARSACQLFSCVCRGDRPRP
ncbi:hypothetical protein [Tychonema sp. LEGE 06208]|nr:hypothetical protein [Tychonema sp. LEGE 06208]